MIKCPKCSKLFKIWAYTICKECYINEGIKRILESELDYSPDYYDEPMIYTCAMCGMEIVSYETVRGHKYCYSCAAIERNG